MTTSVQLIAEARGWLGTRWQHQAAMKGVACDCIGLVRGCAVNVGLLPSNFDETPEYLAYAGYGRVPHEAGIQRAMAQFCNEVTREAMAPGDVVLFAFQTEPQHVGIVGDYIHGGMSLIHAYAPMRKVVEHHFDKLWVSRIRGVYRIKGMGS